MSFIKLLGSSLLVLCCAASLGASVPVDAILSQARAHIGEEEVLDGIRSIRLEGAFANHTDGTAGRFIITMQKPRQHRAEFNNGHTTTVTATDGILGWSRVVDNFDPGNYELRALRSEEHRRMRHNSHDSLYFYSQMDRVRGEARYVERTTKDGFPAHLLEFYFDGDLTFHRYIDVHDGSTIATVNPGGVTVREFGTIRVDGVRFPRLVVAYLEGEEVTRLEHERIVLNETYPDEFFEFPAIEPREMRLPESPHEGEGEP